MGSSVKNRIMRWTRKNMPTREGLASNRWLAPIAHRFLSPELWRFTRRSVPRGVALGLFAGFIVPLGQIFLAAFLALPTRANVPVAALVTFVTNPFTFPFWALAANRLGSFILKIDVATGHSAVREIEGGRLDWLRGTCNSSSSPGLAWIVRATSSGNCSSAATRTTTGDTLLNVVFTGKS